jgi:hypothetical protein
MAGKVRRSMTLGLAALGLLTACAEEPAYYGPLGTDGHSTGYTDLQIDQNRFRVTYAGNSSTPRTTVENFLLLRAAQVTAQAGYPYFMFDTRDTKTKTTYFSTFEGWPGWRGGRYGWYGFGPGGDPFATSESRPITRYDAYAEIVLLSDAQGQGDPRALNAQQVIAHLGPLAAPPPPPK